MREHALTMAVLADPMSRFEAHGVELVRTMISRIGQSGLDLPHSARPPRGPDFQYEQAPFLFGGRQGGGPLHIAWDTNVLSDYFEFGARLWDGDSLPQHLPTEQGDELEALQLLVCLWVLRDIRFHILPGVVTDSKRKPLPAHVRRARGQAWEQFTAALGLPWVAPDAPDDRPSPAPWPWPMMRTALSSVPAGNDRHLVQSALDRDIHVFLTRDKGILKAHKHVAGLGLLLLSPGELLERLFGSGAFHCLYDPQRYLYWPMPDQQRVAHLYSVLPRE